MNKSGNNLQILRISNPVYAYLEITYSCQGKCPGCPATSASDNFLTLSGERWGVIIREFSMFLEEVRLTGGEPALHPDFLSILESLEKEKLPFKIYTNGLWPQPDRIMKALRKSKVFRGWVFSIHGSNASIHRAFSGITNFSEIISNLEKAVKLGLPVYTSTVLGDFNRNNILEILKLTAKLGSLRHYFLRYIGPYRSGISLYRENLKSLLDNINKIPPGIFSYRTGECVPRCFYPGSLPCHSGNTHITINPSGFIKACPFSTEILGRWNFGKKNKIQEKREIRSWTSDFSSGCLRCNEIESCMGGCRVMRRNFLFKRDPLMIEPIKHVNEEGPKIPGIPLYVNGCLRFTGRVRRENFGYLLISEDEAVPVTHKGYELLKLCDGTRGIGEISEIAGGEAKKFLLSLARRGFLELV